MSPSELDDLLQEKPARPLRLTLSSGDQVVMPYPDRAFVAGLMLCFPTGQPIAPNTRVTQKMRIISVPNIAMIEPHEGPMNGGRRRRR
jgi:hypothetical protein